ncbi:MAG: D-alanyl-D-alanine carboxypeptidase [Chloroflexi bacterium]|nr:D-alanyl-D-alanine carboxypeptidase [Chloroflexota bacterium]
MHRFLGLALPWLLILTIPALLGFGPPRLVESDRQQLPVYAGQLPGIAAATPPPLKGMAALVMDAATGRVVYERNGYHHMAPASITKLMTALVTLDRAQLTDRVTIKPEHMVEGSTMGLLPGEQPTVEDLLWGLMLPSGNDAAQALAHTLGGGSAERFIGWMNEKALALGMRDTHFRNSHGLDDDGHYSTAFDMALLARHVLNHPLLARMAATPSHTVRIGQRMFYLANTNRLLDQSAIPGVDGLKTGFTDHAGDSLLASATRNGRRVIVVVLGTNRERTPAAAALIEHAFSAFTWVPVGTPPFGQWPGTSAPPRRIVAGLQREEMVPRWQLPYLRAIAHVTVPPGDGSAQPVGPVGRLVYRTGDRRLIELPLFFEDTRNREGAESGS